MRHAAIDVVGDAVRGADEPRRRQRRQSRHRDRDRVQEPPGRAQRQPEAGDDERELADLRQAQARLDREAHAIAREEGPERHAQRLADDDDAGQDRHDHPVLGDQGGVDEHAHRHEEDGREDVAHRLDERGDGLGLARLADQRPAQERAKRDRVAERARQQRKPEADPDGGDDGGLVAAEAAR